MKIFLKNSSYVQEALGKALSLYFPGYHLVQDTSEADLQWGEYEELDFQAALDNKKQWICSYCIRKALIRKHFLINTIHQYIVKHPDSILTRAVPQAYTLEVDYAEFLDDALDESFELRGELELNEGLPETDRDWFILKPGMAEGGAGIHLFRTIQELTEIFEAQEQEREISEAQHDIIDTGVMTSDMRFFIVQRYLEAPLLLSSLQHRKFHIRAYVLCIGSLRVYLHRKSLLVLCAGSKYEEPRGQDIDLSQQLTNTCYQKSLQSKDVALVHAFWDVIGEMEHQSIYNSMKEVVHDLFDAAVAQRINFQTLPNAFELYGLDFLIDHTQQVHLLEVNAYPDFGQTGKALTYLIHDLFNDTCKILSQHINPSLPSQDTGSFELCYEQGILS